MNIKNSNDYKNSQRNIPKREILELKKICNAFVNNKDINPERAKRETQNPYTKSHTPINIHNNYIDCEKEIFERSKKLRKNANNSSKKNDDQHSMMMSYSNFENSFDGANICIKRKLNQIGYNHSPISKIYAPKKVLNQRENSLGELNRNNPISIINKSNININNVNYINNINTIIKNKSDESLISMAYAKKSPIPHRKDNIMRFNSNININNYMNNEYNNYENNNINNRYSNINYNKYNKKINSNNYNIINYYNNIMDNSNNINTKKKYLIISKTSSMIKKRKQLPEYDDIERSSDNINLNQNKNIRKRNNNFNYNYINNLIRNSNNNLYNYRNFSNNMAYNQQKMKRKNKVIPSIYKNKENDSLSQRYFINNNFNKINNNNQNNYYSNNNSRNNKYFNFKNNYIGEPNNKDIGNYYIINNNDLRRKIK